MNDSLARVLAVVAFFIFAAPHSPLSAQGSLTMPRESQRAEVRQRIGITDVAIIYHAPQVKGRVIWGELVPFGEVWRAGANENTTISLSTDVTIDGKPLAAGTYGLHMLPRKDTWTVIFSSNSISWGSFFYNPAEDVLRIDVTPEVLPHQEWLSYSFTDPKPASVKILMHWEKIGIGFLVETNVTKTVFESIRKELRGSKYYNWESTWQGADYCLKNNIGHDEAMKWIEQSISIRESFLNLNTKAGLVEQGGDKHSADSLRERALAVADESQLNIYGYQLLGSGKVDEAVRIFRMNVQRHPTSWNTYDSLGEALDKQGKTKDAIIQYKTALAKAPAPQKKRISDIITSLEKKGK